MTTLPTATGKAGLSTIFAKAKAQVEASRGKLIFGFDATASRGPTWQAAQELQRAMFQATKALEVQLAVFRGSKASLDVSSWESKPEVLIDLMGQIEVQGGYTQIALLLDHILAETSRDPKRPVNAFVFIGDTFEENSQRAAIKAKAKALGDLGVRGFWFLEADADSWDRANNEATYRELATLSKGAFAPFNLDAVKFLEDLLASVAAYASGGIAALTKRGDTSDAAKLLLTQIK